MITRVEIEGFKSFGSPGETIELSPLNLVVGPNASGKSNFVGALRFLQECIRSNAEIAVNDLGGVNEVRNRSQRRAKSPNLLRIGVILDDEFKFFSAGDGAVAASTEAETKEEVRISDFSYSLSIDLGGKEDERPEIVDEVLTANVYNKGNSDTYEMRRDVDSVSVKNPLEDESSRPSGIAVPDTERIRPAVNVGFFSLPLLMFKRFVETWSFFNISPHTARQSYKERPDASLGMFGENLAVMLRRLESQNGKKELERISGMLRGVIPGFKSVRALKEDHAGRWGLRVEEDHISGLFSPTGVSDGTIRLIALMVVANLGTKQPGVIAIEEPENGLHPHILKHLIDIFRETSKTTQIIATTHNPEFLNHVAPKEVLFCGTVDGVTKVRRADSLKEIESFRKHFSLGELYVQGTFDGMFE